MKAKIVIGLLAAAAALRAQPSIAAADSLENKSPKGAMIRSLLLPGWGQFYNGKWFKGVLIAGTEIGCVVNAAVMNRLAQQAADENERFYYKDSRNLSYWVLAGTILFGAADAYVDAHLANFDESPEVSLQSERVVECFTAIGNRRWRLLIAFPL